MAPLILRSCDFVLPTKNSLSIRSLVFFVLASICIVCCPVPALATAPATGENAYCAKGNASQFGDKDGIAQLPQACFYTGLDGTPSPGKQIRVAAKSDLAAAIDHAKCGDTLVLPTASSFEVRELPPKKCDDQHYITIRTETPDSQLPAEGTRISPGWGGIASL